MTVSLNQEIAIIHASCYIC